MSLREANIVRLSDVEPEEVRWLWYGRIPLGKLTFLNGNPGTAKTMVALDLAARVSRGDRMPDRSESDLDGPRGAVILTAEDDLGDTIRPRLDAADADVKKIAALESISQMGDERLPTIENVDDIREAIESVDAALIVIDPLTAYLPGDTDAHRDASVRRALAPLVQLAEETRVAVLAIRHLNKSDDSRAMMRGMGSIGFTASARSDMIVGEDPDDETGNRCVLAPVKCNLTESQIAMAYQIEVGPNGAPRIDWRGPSPHSPDDLINNKSRTGLSKREQAKEWLKWVLADGPVPTTELKERADETGHAWRTVRRAMDDLGVEKDKDGMRGGWSRKLSDQDQEASEHENLATFEEEKAENPHEDATNSKAATSGEDGRLRDDEPGAKTANDGETGHLREKPAIAGNSGDDSAEDGQDPPPGESEAEPSERNFLRVPKSAARGD